MENHVAGPGAGHSSICGCFGELDMLGTERMPFSMDDLSKIRIPKGALRVEIDDPEKNWIKKPVGVIRGWFATSDLELPEDFHFRVGGVTLPHTLTQRSDVEGAMPDYNILGFNLPYDLFPFLPDISDNRLVIHLDLPGYDPFHIRFRVDDRALAICLEAASL